VIGRAHHLPEDRLFDCYIAERGGETAPLPAAEHLAECRECGARYADLIRFMDAVRREGDVESDEIFTPERLRAQQQQILRRIEHAARPARVIDFPGRLASRHMMPSGGRGVSRWIYAAAAAGLVIGVGLGAVYESEWAPMQIARSAHQMTTGRSRATLTGLSGLTIGAADTADDAFLSDLEVALERPHTRSLQPYDSLTPHVREISDRSH